MRPHRQQPTRLLRPWDSPGKNTGVGCHFLLQCMKVKSESEVAQSCPTLGDPMDCSPPGSSVHGIFPARVLEWVAIPSSHNSIVDQKKNHCERVSLVGHTVSEKPQRNRGTQQDPKSRKGKSRTCLHVGTWSQGRQGGTDFRTKDSSQSVRVT